MPMFTVDLHNHTPLIPSDYRGDIATTPRQIVERALEVGIDVWGIADHWSLDYGARVVAAAAEVAAESGRTLLVLPGAELRIRHDGEETHLVALFPPQDAARRFDLLLAALGLRAPVAPLDELPYFALEYDPLEVARLVAEAGGLCHAGHVDRAFGDYRFIDSELVHHLAECEHVSAIELIDHSRRTPLPRRARDRAHRVFGFTLARGDGAPHGDPRDAGAVLRRAAGRIRCRSAQRDLTRGRLALSTWRNTPLVRTRPPSGPAAFSVYPDERLSGAPKGRRALAECGRRGEGPCCTPAVGLSDGRGFSA